MEDWKYSEHCHCNRCNQHRKSSRELYEKLQEEFVEEVQRNYKYLMNVSVNWRTLKWWKLLGSEILYWIVMGGVMYLFWDFLNKFILW